MLQVASVEIGEEVRIYENDSEDYKGKWDCYTRGNVIATSYDTVVVCFGTQMRRYRLADLRRTTVYYERLVLVPVADGVAEE